MEKNYNKITGKTNWILDKWYQKTILIIGWIMTIYLGGAFIIGFIYGIIEELS